MLFHFLVSSSFFSPNTFKCSDLSLVKCICRCFHFCSHWKYHYWLDFYFKSFTVAILQWWWFLCSFCILQLSSSFILIVFHGIFKVFVYKIMSSVSNDNLTSLKCECSLFLFLDWFYRLTYYSRPTHGQDNQYHWLPLS
jgi:hypothetical protein